MNFLAHKMLNWGGGDLDQKASNHARVRLSRDARVCASGTGNFLKARTAEQAYGVGEK